MKNILPYLVIIFFLFGSKSMLNAQCAPDPSCTDINNPGEICPLNLPDGTVGVPYNEVVTIIPPFEANLGTGTVDIAKIQIVSVDNLPPGLSYTASAVDMFPYNSYCVLLNGIPTTANTYQLEIRVKPFIDIMGTPVAAPEQVDDTTLAITIADAAGINDVKSQNFSILNISKNPFQSNTKISYYTASPQKITLCIYNILGEKIFSHKELSTAGVNYFEVNGTDLNKGMYIFSINNGDRLLTKQIVKK